MASYFSFTVLASLLLLPLLLWVSGHRLRMLFELSTGVGAERYLFFLLDLWVVGLVVAEGFAGAGGEVFVQAGIV